MPTPEELEAKRAEAIAKKEAARVERVEEIKAKKAEKAEERRKEEERQAEEKRKADEKKAELEALAKKREEAIAQKEAERKQRANEIKEKKKKKQSSKYSKAEILLLKEVYDQYDSDNSGSVTITEMQAALKDSNLVDSTESMLRELDKDGNGSVDFKELLKLLYPYATATDFDVMLAWVAPPEAPPPPPPRGLSPHQIEEINKIFSLYDTDGSGGLTVKELKDAMKDTFLTADEIQEMFSKSDRDEDTLLDKEEFRALMVSTGMWDADF